MSLSRLICGDATDSCVANTALDHLSNSIARFSEKSINYLNNPFSEEAESFGAFCARVTLENACAALVGRLDPFRILYLTEYQSQSGFEYGKPVKSGFKWTGDVLSEDKPTKDLWSADHDIAKISRALFSPHVDHVYWRPATEAALDYLAAYTGEGDLTELKKADPEAFIGKTKGRCAAIYSTLSKGVHWEFFTSAVTMDEGTLKDTLRDCLLQVGTLGFFSHFVSTSYRALEKDVALAAYLEFRGKFQ
ncbi:hypothetical protein AFCDBAGC_5127 [Methylobacterium cerastii]|uniref:Uncharacterized protein n=1 Tax=Methylobacterium cerastii TaxID=932741 RepID=A0ABQ4QPL5_9HYPH|nr:hypothetical protein [Methylobacterium cerastii]GJD47235.1 hypothetical protein AFCDBAGC_5127 [Methylobacterium cerastii]